MTVLTPRLYVVPSISESGFHNRDCHVVSLKTISAKIKDNIAFSNPMYATDEKLISEAVRLGGADSMIKCLSDGWDTYLSHPDSVYDVIHIKLQ